MQVVEQDNNSVTLQVYTSNLLSDLNVHVRELKNMIKSSSGLSGCRKELLRAFEYLATLNDDGSVKVALLCVSDM
jgi:hypothetical protein